MELSRKQRFYVGLMQVKSWLDQSLGHAHLNRNSLFYVLMLWFNMTDMKGDGKGDKVV